MRGTTGSLMLQPDGVNRARFTIAVINMLSLSLQLTVRVGFATGVRMRWLKRAVCLRDRCLTLAEVGALGHLTAVNDTLSNVG